MKLNEIAIGEMTLTFDPDEARILAAACRVAAGYVVDAGTPVVNPFDAFGEHDAVLGCLLEAYQALFEAAGMAAHIHNEIGPRRPGGLVSFELSAIRKEGTGWRFPFRTEEGGNDVPEVAR